MLISGHVKIAGTAIPVLLLKNEDGNKLKMLNSDIGCSKNFLKKESDFLETRTDLCMALIDGQIIKV